jgi:hypothetical protein
MGSKETLHSLTLQMHDLSQQERELICTVFFEELSLNDVALKAEDYQRLNSILTVLRTLPPLDGIAWVMEQLHTTYDDSDLRGPLQNSGIIDDEAI